MFFHMTQQSSTMILIHWLTLLQSTRIRPVCPHRPSKWPTTFQTVIRRPWLMAARPMALQMVVSWLKDLAIKSCRLWRPITSMCHQFISNHQFVFSIAHKKAKINFSKFASCCDLESFVTWSPSAGSKSQDSSECMVKQLIHLINKT